MESILENINYFEQPAPIQLGGSVLVIKLQQTGLGLNFETEEQLITVDSVEMARDLLSNRRFHYLVFKVKKVNPELLSEIECCMKTQGAHQALAFLFSTNNISDQEAFSLSELGLHESFSGPFHWELIASRIANYRTLLNKVVGEKDSNYKLRDRIELLESFKNELNESMSYAKAIQHDILPSREDIRMVFQENFQIYKPKNVVSGDFYWFTMKNESALFALADCTGHGVPGAMMSMLGSNMLDYAVNDLNNDNPGAILSRVNQRIHELFSSYYSSKTRRDGMDVALIAYNKRNNRIEFSGAKRPMILIRNKTMLTEVKGDSATTGKDSPYDFNYCNTLIQLQKGDTLYLYSDGLQDQFGGERNKKFGAKQLKSLLLSIQDRSMEDQREIIEQELNAWKGNLEQTDDISMFAFRV